VIAFIKKRLPGLWLADLLVMLVVAESPVAATPPWVVRTWQSDEGLPDNTVVGIEQTPDGFLWVATKTGLVRFDGVRFQAFPVTATGAPAGGIKALVSDRRGRLWLAKDYGVVLCVDQGVTTLVVGPEIAVDGDGGERLMVSDAEDAVWVCYSGGVVLRIRDGQVRSFTEADGLPGGSGCQLAVGGTGQLWFAQGDWVGVFREGRFCPLAQQTFQRITGAHGAGGIWGYRSRQVWRFAEGGSPVKLGALPDDVPEGFPTAMREDRAGCLWLGTLKAGLFRFDQDGGVTVPLPQQTILTVQEDREGNLWAGTRGGGLNQLKPRVIELLNTGSATQFEPVQSLCQDTEGILWAVVWPEGRLIRRAGQAWSSLSPEDGWTTFPSECVAADPRGGVWIGTGNAGVQHWQNGAVTETLDPTNGLANNEVGALLVTASGEVWIGPRAVEVVQCWKGGQLRTLPMPPGSGSVIALATDAVGDLWVATYGCRLLRVHGEVVTEETANTLAGPCEIRGLVGTPDGSLWIGYAGQGLGRLKAGRFSQWRTGQGLHDDYICNILPDGRGRLWFAGNRGIFSVRENDFDECAAGRATQVRSVAYGRKDGLLRLQANFNFWPGAQRGTDGRLLFTMQSGIAAVSADNIQENPEPPPVVIERVTANGKTVAAYQAGELPETPNAGMPLELSRAGSRLHLPPGQQRVEFAFTALTFTKPEAIGFRYRLYPVDKDWVEAGTLRSATYAQIPPGHYQFQVSACNNEGAWNTADTALDLTAEPYWWETAWFRVLGPLAAAGLLGWGILSGVQRRHRRRIERLEMLRATERERARIARDMHDEIGGSLTKIGKLAAGLPDPAIAETTREVVWAMDQVVWTINPRNDTLDSLATYLVHYTEEFLRPAGIACELDIPLILPDVMLSSDLRHNLFLTTKEALNNAVKHGAPRRVRLGLTANGGLLTLTVRDDGCGFSPAPPAAGADGLGNMRERLAAIGGDLHILSVPGQGTTITMQVSLNPTNHHES
jgi:signal transduction histidine kinase/ligand-binding sensor domain-containing protein